MKKFNEEEYFNERVPLTVSDGDGDVTVTVNGVNYVIKCGVTVSVPRKVALVIENSIQQSKCANAYLRQLEEGRARQ